MGMVQRIYCREQCGREGENMIRIGQVKIRTGHTNEELVKRIERILGVTGGEIDSFVIRKRSVDARKKPEIYYVYTIDVKLKNEKKEKGILSRGKKKDLSEAKDKPYLFPTCEENRKSEHRPVIVGSGPAGLFCAYFLARHGYRPILIERGAPVEERKEAVEAFWKTGVLDIETNVQFGEGGAGTFSDGKLNTLVKDPVGRNREVLKIFVEHGAPEEILYENKPHIGTDILIHVVKKMRESIEFMGGECRFYTKMCGIHTENGKIKAIQIEEKGQQKILPADVVVLALGHSARDTFHMLHESGVFLEPKSFAVGVRVEHLQEQINESQYGIKQHPDLPAAAYKLTAKASNGRGVYTFCMCPGGYVVNASSEKERLCVNGMSYHGRAGENANSAVIVTVTPDDYADYGYKGALAGVEFQRCLEERAFQVGKGRIPVQCFGDFKRREISTEFGKVKPQMKGAYQFGNVREIFPDEIASSIEEGMEAFERKIPGFASEDAILSGVESRTSSPLRMTRDETMQSVNISGLYPCGEGAGYAGGITSAAMDGIKTAEAIAKRYQPEEHH